MTTTDEQTTLLPCPFCGNPPQEEGGAVFCIGSESAGWHGAINMTAAMWNARAAMQPTVAQAAEVLLAETTIVEKDDMNEAGVQGMFPMGWTITDKIAFDKGRIAALRALTETPEDAT